MNMVSASAGKFIRQVRKALRMDFLPKEEPGSGGKKSSKKSGKKEKKGKDPHSESDPAKSSPVEWQRVNLDGSETPFARTGGGREDVRPPDFDRYVTIGLGAGDQSGDPADDTCKQIKISLVVETDCLDGQDKLVIDLLPKFDASGLKGLVATNKEGEHTYFTVKSPDNEMEFISYIPEITSPGAIRVRHQKLATMANLGVQFFVRAL